MYRDQSLTLDPRVAVLTRVLQGRCSSYERDLKTSNVAVPALLDRESIDIPMCSNALPFPRDVILLATRAEPRRKAWCCIDARHLGTTAQLARRVTEFVPASAALTARALLHQREQEGDDSRHDLAVDTGSVTPACREARSVAERMRQSAN